MKEPKKIILFDGVCNLCNGFVQFVIQRDSTDAFQFASLQSEVAKKLLLERNINAASLDSIILIDPGVAYYVKSDAALAIGRHLKGYRTISQVLRLIPNGFRNIVYDFVARYRYQWFGKMEECMVPTPEVRAKFL